MQDILRPELGEDAFKKSEATHNLFYSEGDHRLIFLIIDRRARW